MDPNLGSKENAGGFGTQTPRNHDYREMISGVIVSIGHPEPSALLLPMWPLREF